MARSVRVQAMVATEAADGRLLAVHEQIWLIPEIADTTPTTPANKTILRAILFSELLQQQK